MLTDFHWNKAKKKIKIADSKKLRFLTPQILNFFFSKISGIGTWVSTINCCNEHQYDSTYMVDSTFLTVNCPYVGQPDDQIS